MKRAVPSSPPAPLQHCSSGTTTRSSTRRRQRQACARQCAVELMATPLLQALPGVLSSGYLYADECIHAASTCQSWFRVWKEVAQALPENAKVQVVVECINSQRDQPPQFVHRNGLLDDMHTPKFVRQIFDKVNELKCKAKKGNAAQKRFMESLPEWGSDIRHVHVSYWGPNQHNSGGMSINYHKKIKRFPNGRVYMPGRASLMVRVDPNLRLWTGIRNWDDYDGTPLWP